MRIVKVYGTAGTGKTTWVLNRVADDLLMDRLPLFFTFTTSARNEFFERLSSLDVEVPKSSPLRYYSGTIHSFALKVTGFAPKYNIDAVVRAFMWRKHIPYSKDPYDTARIGNVWESAITYAIHTAKSTDPSDVAPYIQEYRRHYAKTDFSVNAFLSLYHDYVRWKESKGLLDFNDLLIHALDTGVKVEVDKVYVDEAQDLSPLMADVLFNCVDADEFVFVGDPLQNIYEPLMGSDPELFMNLKGEELVLERSHRVPSAVFQHALIKSSAPPELLEKYRRVQTRPGGRILRTTTKLDGLVNILSRFQEKKVMLLAPTNSIATQVAVGLFRRGVLVSGLKSNILMNEMLFFTQLIKDIRDGFDPFTEAHELKRQRIERELKRYGVNERAMGVLFSPLYPLETKLSLLTSIMRERGIIEIHAVGRLDFALHVYVDTYHASKGREADVVFLIHPRYFEIRVGKPRLERSYRRVLFTGMTRTRDTLVMVDELMGVKV